MDTSQATLKAIQTRARACRDWMIAIWWNIQGQDLVEYALMAGFVTVAAGATIPPMAASISTVFSKVSSILDKL
jgi:Flp pilus assembly pilin Flp